MGAADGHTITGLTHGPSGRGKLVRTASARYSITAGKKIMLQVKLNATGQSLLSRYGRVPATLRISLTCNGYTIPAATARVTFNR